jgi:signal transduction histidine kinase
VNLVRAIDHPVARTRAQGCLRAAGISALALLSATDPLIAAAANANAWPVSLVLALGLAAILWPTAKRPVWLTPHLRTAVPAVGSGALTLVSALIGRTTQFGPGEVLVLLCLLMIAVRTCSPRWAGLCAALTGAAVITLPLRVYQTSAENNDLGTLFGLLLVLVLLVGVIAGIGGYLRTLDHRRQVAVTESRRSERLTMAADLHDFVAHHVTGILVQTQMARLMVPTAPDRLDPVLAGIEHAATEALASMRRTVGILRENPTNPAGPGSTDRHPAGDLMTLADLVEGFNGPGRPKTALQRAPSLPQNLPHELQAAAYRVVQEALTNVLRHAADATEVTVGLSYDHSSLCVTVRDNGGAIQTSEMARSGGFGLVGLMERVSALGGEWLAGPRPHGGWEVVARFPATEPGRRLPDW